MKTEKNIFDMKFKNNELRDLAFNYYILYGEVFTKSKDDIVIEVINPSDIDMLED